MQVQRSTPFTWRCMGTLAGLAVPADGMLGLGGLDSVQHVEDDFALSAVTS
jgi:hypothetical protein